MRVKNKELAVESFPDLKNRYWGRHFWARGIFV